MKKILTLTLLLCAISYAAVAGRPAIVAHRGYHYDGIPENSVASLIEAANLGSDYTEFDVWITSDNELVIHHDANAIVNGTPYYIPETEKSFLKDNYRLSNNEPIPLLTDFLDAVVQSKKQGKEIGLVIEIKMPGDKDARQASYIKKDGKYEGSRLEAAVNKTIALVEEYGLEEKVIYISFAEDACIFLANYYKEKDIKCPVYFLTGSTPERLKEMGVTGADFSMGYFRGNDDPQNWVDPHPDIINEVHAAGMPFIIWTVNNLDDMKYFIDRDVDFLTTDFPNTALELVKNAFSCSNSEQKTQDGHHLERIDEKNNPIVSTNLGTDLVNRTGLRVNDHIFVIQRSVAKTGPVLGDSHGAVKIYDNKGNRLQTILPPKGYYVWASANVDAAGHVLVRVDQEKPFDGESSLKLSHGFMVLGYNNDTDQYKIIYDFLPLGYGNDNLSTPKTEDDGHNVNETYRHDAMPPVLKDIMKDYNVRIISVYCGKGTTFSAQHSYNKEEVKEDGYPTFWKGAAFKTAFNDEQAHQTTGYAVEYYALDGDGKTDTYLAVYSNPKYSETYSGAEKNGNSIRHFNTPGNWKSTNMYYYTPMHSGLTGFNIFTIGKRQFIIYPAIDPGQTRNQDNRPADAFAIAEIILPSTNESIPVAIAEDEEEDVVTEPTTTMLTSPATHLSDEGETLVDGKPVGALKAIFPGTGVVGNTSCIPSYTVEPVEDNNKAVKISVYNTGAPVSQWMFSVDDNGIISSVEDVAAATDAEAPVEYFNLQGVRVLNPSNGIFIKKQGKKVTKIAIN